MTTDPIVEEPLLRTLSPALRELEKTVRKWINAPRFYPLSTLTKANLEGLASDMHRKAQSLELEKPLLVIMLMGGTGVGKSTLLNALAGGPIAQASFARPTTRDPVVYFHESVQSQRLDSALQQCRLAQHDRPDLEQKIIVDTPDLDSNDLANREKLQHILPVADIVLYVGSQEKYHDKLGWDLFLKQRQRRAFAFVLNKWDRCLVSYAAQGVRPDEDLIQDLEKEGFENPRVFRTCAQYWVDRAGGNGQETNNLPEGEQFQELVQWLEMGLGKLEIEAIKARGVSQLLRQLEHAFKNAKPPDLTAEAERTKKVWIDLLKKEAEEEAKVLLDTLEPYQREVEHHFALQRQEKFHNLMAGYLTVFNHLKYAGSTLRDRIPFAPKGDKQSAAPSSWDLISFSRACSKTAAERHLDARGKAMVDRMLIIADEQGFPVRLLTDPTEKAHKIDWQQRYSNALIDVMGQVEHGWTRPSGFRKFLQTFFVFLANTLPPIFLLAAYAVVLWKFFMEENSQIGLTDFLLPLPILLVVLVTLHILIAVFLPLRWNAIRTEISALLGKRVFKELEIVYAPVPEEVVHQLNLERRQVDGILSDVREVTGWLEQREQAASIAGLYGN